MDVVGHDDEGVVDDQDVVEEDIEDELIDVRSSARFPAYRLTPKQDVSETEGLSTPAKAASSSRTQPRLKIKLRLPQIDTPSRSARRRAGSGGAGIGG